MSLLAEFDLPASAFALTETLSSLPEAAFEIERVAASENKLTPYFWVSNGTDGEFEEVAETDPSISDLRRLDSFDDATLYRAEWTDTIGPISYAYTEVDAVILSAIGSHDTWEMQMRFDDHRQLSDFRTYCRDKGITIQLNYLQEVTEPYAARQYGLTEKQREALVRTWEAGYFESPSETSLDAVAANLGVSQQALSQRLRNGHNALIANTLVAEPQADK